MVNKHCDNESHDFDTIPETGKPSRLQLERTLVNKVYYQELCKRYGAPMIEKLVMQLMANRP